MCWCVCGELEGIQSIPPDNNVSDSLGMGGFKMRTSKTFSLSLTLLTKGEKANVQSPSYYPIHHLFSSSIAVAYRISRSGQPGSSSSSINGILDQLFQSTIRHAAEHYHEQALGQASNWSCPIFSRSSAAAAAMVGCNLRPLLNTRAAAAAKVSHVRCFVCRTRTMSVVQEHKLQPPAAHGCADVCHRRRARGWGR